MSNLASVESPPREQPAKKYLRPRLAVSWPGLVVGLIFGAALGLFYAWGVNPVEEIDTEPWQLRNADKAHLIVAIMLDYAYDSNLNQAVNRLVELKLEGDPIQAVANAACDLARTGYVESSSGLRALRAMMTFYQLQGKSGCADTLMPAPDMQPTTVVEVLMPTATFIPPATKTPTPVSPAQPTPTPVQLTVPTAAAQDEFVLVNASTFCDAARSGLIEVYVQDEEGGGIPGQKIRVRWDSGEDTFFTGLMPDRGPGYADFIMEANLGYTIDLPGRSEPVSNPLSATPCTADDGGQTITGYRIVFRPS